jgi:hypothetical protein
MKYRIQVLVSADRLAAVVAAAFSGELDYDPEMKMWPASEPKTPERAGYAATRKPPLPRAPIVGGNPKVNKRAELVVAALKTGPKRWSELKTALSDGGLSENSLNSVIGKMQKQGKVSRSQDGLWSLNDAPTQRADAG